MNSGFDSVNSFPPITPKRQIQFRHSSDIGAAAPQCLPCKHITSNLPAFQVISVIRPPGLHAEMADHRIWRMKAIVRQFVFCRVYFSLPKRALNFITLPLRFYPILHITTVTADITDDRNFFNQCKSWSINIVSAGMSVLVIRNMDNILWAAFGTAFRISQIGRASCRERV